MAERGWVVERLGEVAFERLASELSGSELQSVLLEVMRRRAARREPKELLAQYERDGFCRPAPVDLRESLAIDAELLAAAQGFEAVELAPVAPLGSCSVIAPTHQNRVLSALRTTELMADPSNVLALECASRLRARPDVPLHLATSQRVIRAQPIPKLAGYARHFRIFVLGSAGLETKDHAFTLQTVLRHLRALLAALDRLEQRGYDFGTRRVKLLASDVRRPIAQRIADELGARVTVGPLEHAYYSGGLRFMVWATAPDDGSSLPLFDGGAFDWVARLSSNRRAVFVASGGGSQLIAVRFRAASPAR